MAGLEAVSLYVLVPLGAAVASVLLLNSGAQDTPRSLPEGAIPDRGRSKLPVAFALVAVPIILGLVLWLVAEPLAGALDAGTWLGAAGADAMLFWAAAAFAFAVACADASLVLAIRPRMGGFLGSDFGRLLPLVAIPVTGVMFALVLNLLLLGYLSDFMPVSTARGLPPLASPAAMDAVVGAFQAYTLATLAFPAATVAANRVRDMSRRGLMRAAVFLELGELPVLVGLILGFLAIAGLTPGAP